MRRLVRVLISIDLSITTTTTKRCASFHGKKTELFVSFQANRKTREKKTICAHTQIVQTNFLIGHLVCACVRCCADESTQLSVGEIIFVAHIPRA